MQVKLTNTPTTTIDFRDHSLGVLILNPSRKVTMKLFVDLFSTDYGLMSVVVIACTLGMAAWYRAFFKRKMAEDAKNAEAS